MTLQFDLITNDYPYHLLLLADETVEAIDQYLFDSSVYKVRYRDETVGVLCLLPLDEKTVELKNIAASESHQGVGLGSKIIDFIKSLTRNQYQKLIVGTPDIAHRQIRFYERNGFVKYGVRKNFYIENYSAPIIEDGVQLRDMVLLAYGLNLQADAV